GPGAQSPPNAPVAAFFFPSRGWGPARSKWDGAPFALHERGPSNGEALVTDPPRKERQPGGAGEVGSGVVSLSTPDCTAKSVAATTVSTVTIARSMIIQLKRLARS